MDLALIFFEGNFDQYVGVLQKQHNLFCFNANAMNKSTSIEQLLITNFEYLIIMTRDEKKSKAAMKWFCSRGVEKEKILEYVCFEKDPRISPVERFWSGMSEQKYDTLIFGMSHSYGGLIPELLHGNAYKFSAPSMDLYYHYRVLRDICENYNLSKIKQVIFELPYYAFNYDLSMCKSTFRKRISYYSYYSDYHHFGENEEEKRYIDMFEKLNELSGFTMYGKREKAELIWRKKTSVYLWLRKQYVRFRCATDREPVSRQWTEEAMQTQRPHVWYKEHLETIQENLKIWSEIKQLLEQNKLELRVCIFPFNPLFLEIHSDQIYKIKNKFFENLCLPETQVFDGMDIFMGHQDYFADACHLNNVGSYQFSKILGRWLKHC